MEMFKPLTRALIATGAHKLLPRYTIIIRAIRGHSG